MVSAAPSSPASREARLPGAPPAGNTAKSAGTRSGSANTTRLCLLVLFVNCCAAIYRSRHDPWSVAFVATSFTVLALLFHFIHRFEAEPPGSSARERIKAAVWILTSVLTGMFSYKVAAVLPLAAAIAVWATGAGTVLAGFYMFFLCGGDAAAAEQADSDDEPLKAAEDGAHKQPTSGRYGVPDLHQPILSS